METLIEVTGAPGLLVVLSWVAYEVFRLRNLVEFVVKRQDELERKVVHHVGTSS